MLRPYRFTGEGRRIIAVDGEGNDIDGRHAYTLLAAADDRGEIRRHIAHDDSRKPGVPGVTQPNYGLSSKACFDFLLDLAEDAPSDLLVAFSFTYDAVKICSDLPLPNLLELAATERTEWEGYRIDFRPRKYFGVSQPKYGRKRCADGMTRYVRQAKVWDAFGYFQSSFVKALENTGAGVFTDEERALIEEIAFMKRHRSHFENMDEQRILEYCYSEVSLLAKMMRDVIVNTERMGLFPKSFHGSSAIAYTWMKDNRIPNFIGNAGLSDDVVNAAYFGGRFETTCVGYVGKGYAYDIRSAYPAVMVNLPCLAHATSRRVSDFVPGKYGVYLVGSKTSGDWAPFPIRIDRDAAKAHTLTPNRSASEWLRPLMTRQVLFAHGGRRWVWQDELEVARRHYGADAIPVYDGYVLDIGCDHRPFAGVQKLYDDRAELKKLHDGRQMVIKLLVNSLYGKTAQSVGHQPKKGVTHADIERRRIHARETGTPLDLSDLIEPPETLCRIWAGMITSGTRAKILDLMLSAGSVISVATDGIISTKPIPGLEDHKRLGDWEFEEYEDLVIYQNGVYAYKAFDDDSGEWVQKVKTRGFSPQDITPEMLREAWDSGLWSVAPKDDARGFVAMRLAMKRKDPLDVMGQWLTQRRPVDFIPTKRHLTINPFSLEKRPDCLPTVPYELDYDTESLPYVPHQTWEDVAELEGWIGDGNDDDDLPFIQDELAVS